MKKYMILAKNDYNEEIFYTDIKAEAKSAFDRMMDKYLFVKAFCYNKKDGIYQDITDSNSQSVYRVHTWERKYFDTTTGELIYDNDHWNEFTNEAEALRFIINSNSNKCHCALYKNGRRDWSV